MAAPLEEKTLQRKKLTASLLAGAATAGLMVAAAPTSGAAVGHSKMVNWSKVTHLTKTGPTDLANLIKAAKKEGRLNTVALPDNWANYGQEISTFKHKYGIKVYDYNPDGSSAEEISDIASDTGRSDDPDVVDVGESFAIQAVGAHLLARYKVQTYANIPAGQKSPYAYWYADYGGYVAIGCDTKTVKHCPTTFKQMLRTGQGYKIGLNNSPTEAAAAFDAVWAAALSNGGSFNNIKPGINYFAKLNKEGNFVDTTAGANTVLDGTTNILVWWDYLQASEIKVLKGYSKIWKITIPSDGVFAAYYAQAINKHAPDPAAARLWEEFLYSTQGQNLWLKGETRPIELPYLVAHHLANKTWLAKLPPAPKGVTKFPTQTQTNKAELVVEKDWASEI